MGSTLRQPASPFVSVLRWFEKYHVRKTKDQGTDWYYEATAVVLTQEAGGAVIGDKCHCDHRNNNLDYQEKAMGAIAFLHSAA
jgi:hypothetical protein